MACPRILLSPGEPAGIGPDILIQIAQQPWNAELIAVIDSELLQNRARQLNLELKTIEFDSSLPAEAHIPGTLKIISHPLASPVIPGKLNSENAHYVIECLQIATDFCLRNHSALVTGPVQKSILQNAGISFSGHTEFLRDHCGVEKTLMLFVTSQMKVALATTHLPLKEVPQAITPQLLEKTLRLLHKELIRTFKINDPTILVCGLNPHAGEQGCLGNEEVEIISPTLEQLRHDKIKVVGPLPADTIFTEKFLKMADAILAMYHDQALPVIKSLGFNEAVNITLGLPIIRTSVDHGTALDIAGTGTADSGSMQSAIRMAIDLVRCHEK